jgi:exopolyphosphatase/guanosine-5'-triphosphate,3'-diphosphate pyrophosphatase
LNIKHKPMRIAIIDLGTNTFHLLIAETNGKNFEILYKTNEAVRLGEGKINENIIIPVAFNRGVETLKKFSDKITEFGVSKVKATATSAIRSAINGQDFVKEAKKQANINIDIITGEAEAGLIYEGVKLSGAIINKSLIIDIGGGSVEFILCDLEKLIWKKSYNVGAARLMQLFFNSDPLSNIDKMAILKHLENELSDLFDICEQHLPLNLIGSAGAFETFAQLVISKKQQNIDINTMKTYQFNFDEYIANSIKILNATHDERAKMPGMIPLRVDMCVMATLITNYIMGRLKINNLSLSTYDLKMGVLAKLIN